MLLLRVFEASEEPTCSSQIVLTLQADVDLLLSLSLLLTDMLQLLLVKLQLSSLELSLLPLQNQSEPSVLVLELYTLGDAGHAGGKLWF